MLAALGFDRGFPTNSCQGQLYHTRVRDPNSNRSSLSAMLLQLQLALAARAFAASKRCCSSCLPWALGLLLGAGVAARAVQGSSSRCPSFRCRPALQLRLAFVVPQAPAPRGRCCSSSLPWRPCCQQGAAAVPACLGASRNPRCEQALLQFQLALAARAFVDGRCCCSSTMQRAWVPRGPRCKQVLLQL